MSRYQDLTKYIVLFEKETNFGQWIGEDLPDEERKRDENGKILPYIAPYVLYSPIVSQFITEVKHYHSGFSRDAMKENAMEFTEHNLLCMDLSNATPALVLSFIQKIVNKERFRDGCILEYLQNGRIVELLKKLKTLDK